MTDPTPAPIVSTGAAPNTIPLRSATGTFQSGTPVKGADVATKQYVDVMGPKFFTAPTLETWADTTYGYLSVDDIGAYLGAEEFQGFNAANSPLFVRTSQAWAPDNTGTRLQTELVPTEDGVERTFRRHRAYTGTWSAWAEV
jgi:hypothetical protein